jgi:hypothetical protein
VIPLKGRNIMNTLLVGIILLLLVGVGIYILALATRLVKAVEVIANRLDG